MGVRDDVEKKLVNSILPRIEGATLVRRSRRHIAYNLHRYLAEGALVTLGLGFSHPVLVAMSGGKLEAAGDIGAAFAQFHPAFLACSTCVALLWVIMRTYVSVEKLAEKGPITIVTIRELEAAKADLNELLLSATPTKSLGVLQERVKTSVDRAHSAGAWPWALGPSDDSLRTQYAAEAKRLCDSLGKDWVDPDLQRPEPGAAA